MSTPAPGAATDDRAGHLARRAEQAAALRALRTHPDVLALRIERVGAQVDALLWAGIALGLLFTTVNVQRFAADGAPPFTLMWWAAWLLDPMVSLVLLAVVRAEQVTARHGLRPSGWARVTKWAAFTATYVMNTWEAWGLDAAPPSPAGIVLHSIPPLLVLLAAEAGPGLREQLAHAAAIASETPGPVADVGEPGHAGHEPASGHEQPTPDVRERRASTVHEPARAAGSGSHRGADPPRRRLLGDYLTDARAALVAASASGEPPTVTPSWCRAVTGCSAGTSVKLAAALRAQDVIAMSP